MSTEFLPPTLGRIVIYRSKIDNGPGNDVLSPAMVVRTRATTVPAVIERWADLPPGATTLVGHEGGKRNGLHETGARPENLIVDLPDDHTVDLAVFGLGKTYREYGVSMGGGRGQWSWPERA